jgi:hypothetical protein
MVGGWDTAAYGYGGKEEWRLPRIRTPESKLGRPHQTENLRSEVDRLHLYFSVNM